MIEIYYNVSVWKRSYAFYAVLIHELYGLFLWLDRLISVTEKIYIYLLKPYSVQEISIYIPQLVNKGKEQLARCKFWSIQFKRNIRT